MPQTHPAMSKIILFNKPFGVLSQFTDSGTAGSPRPTLSAFIDLAGVYAAGRLDKDSEGLLVLTDDGKLQHQISDPKHKTPKSYWVQVEGAPTQTVIETLRTGIDLKDGMTGPANVRIIPQPPELWTRVPPVRYRKSIPDTWLEIVISEGRNRQVRRAIGHPTLRLIRNRIGSWKLGDLATGTWRNA